MIRPVRLRNGIIAVLAMGLAACVLVLVFYVLPPNPKPIGLTVARITQEPGGSSVALVELTNQTHTGFNQAFWTEVLSNGVWVDAAAQHQDAKLAGWLAPHRGHTLEVPVPREGVAWRIHLVGGRALSRGEMLVYRVWRRLKVPDPFAQDLDVYSETNEVLVAPNKSGQGTAR